ncbi:MAG: DUF2066 domain-containing protein [Magnetospirillum sp.]|nr:DUF2066 domain-containing protein [Magnetospirillum sp.]
MPSRRLFAALLSLLLATAFGQAAAAQGVPDAFTVRGVEVDVTATSANDAKDQALADGQRQAFRQLLERLTDPADHARLPNADAENYVRDFAIDQERTSSVRYMATLTVRFKPAAVKTLLRQAGIPFTEARSRPVVVLPVLSAEGRTALWDDPNPWRAAWAGLGGDSLVPLVIPPGDPTDVQTISVQQALAADPGSMAAEGARWRTADVMVAAATLSADSRRLDVTLSSLPGTPAPFDSVAYDLQPGENADQMMARAARDVSRAIDTGYKQANLLRFGHPQSLAALVPLTGLDDWLTVRERLARVPQVQSYDLVSLSRVEAALVLHVVGDQDKAKAALANAGLPMEWANGYWTMRPIAQR